MKFASIASTDEETSRESLALRVNTDPSGRIASRTPPASWMVLPTGKVSGRFTDGPFGGMKSA